MTTKKTRTLATSALACLLALCASAVLAGTEGRISGEVLDTEGNPIPGVQVTVAAVGLDIQRTAETNKKGKFTITVLNASQDWTIRVEKEGYQTVQEPIDPQVGATLKPVYTLVAGETVAPEQLAELKRKGKAADLYNDGVKKFGAGDVDGAKELFEQSLAEDPELGPAHLALARIFLARDDAASALPHAEKTNELLPEDDLAQLVLFDSLWDLERVDRALPLLDQMVASGKVPDKVAVRAYNAGARDVKLDDHAAAKMRFEQALELDPTLKPAHYTLAAITLNNGDVAAALGHATAYAEANPEDAKALSMLYLVMKQAGDEAGAQAAFDRMVAADPEMVAQTFFEEGVTHFNAGRNELALAAFEKVLRAQPDNAHAHYFLGLASASAGDIVKAKQYLTRFLELAPEHPEAPVARDMLAGL